MTDRILSLEGVHNFRDYGGYATADGGRLRDRVLWRSGQHFHATPDDLVAVSSLSLRTVVDLRGNSERTAWPCLRPENFEARVFFFNGETKGSEAATHSEAEPTITTSGDAHAAMLAIYASMPFLPNLQSVLRDYFEALATRDGASLLHCFSGKDRTGFGVAVLHDLLGVHADDIIADYMLTNTAGNSEARIAAGVESIRRSKGVQISDSAIRILMSVAPDYINAAFNSLRQRRGSVASYARHDLGVDNARLAAIRERLLT
jgi:protein-tyrosine phosphatase